MDTQVILGQDGYYLADMAGIPISGPFPTYTQAVLAGTEHAELLAAPRWQHIGFGRD
jgi:hypothetical protein